MFAGHNGVTQLTELLHVLIRSLADVAPGTAITNCARNECNMKVIANDCILNRERCIVEGSPEYQARQRYENP